MQTSKPPCRSRPSSPTQPPVVAPAPLPSPEAIAKAEAFAEENIETAAQIRHGRGVTSQNQAYFREVTPPADPAVIDALLRGSGMC